MIPEYALPPPTQGRDDGGACLPPPPPLPPAPFPRFHHPHSSQMPCIPPPPPPPALINTECLPEGMSSEDAAAICDFDRLVRHQDFGKILSSAARLKNLQSQGSHDPALNPAAKTPGIMNLALSDLHSEKAANIVRENTCTTAAPSSASSTPSPPPVLPRGLFPYADALVDETIDSLVAEFDRCLSIIAQATGGDDGAPSAKKARRKPPKGKKKAGGNASQSIAVKYSKQQTDILTDWMIQNRVSFSEEELAEGPRGCSELNQYHFDQSPIFICPNKPASLFVLPCSLLMLLTVPSISGPESDPCSQRGHRSDALPDRQLDHQRSQTQPQGHRRARQEASSLS